MNYDQIIIGNGPDAAAAAIATACRGQRVALARRSESRNQLTPQMLRQAVGRFLASNYRTMPELRQLVADQIESDQASEQSELDRLGVEVLTGDIRFLDPQSIQVGADKATADTIVLATGTRSASLGQAPFDGTRILAAEDLLSLPELPQSMIVVGAGQTGLDYAVLLARLGVNVTVVDEHSNYFQLCGGLMGVTLFAAQSLDIAFRLGEEVIGIQQTAGGSSVAVRLSSGRVLTSDAALVCVGREGQTEGLDLESAGVGLDEHGRIWCDAHGRTWAAGITAIGDVVGFRATPSLAG